MPSAPLASVAVSVAPVSPVASAGRPAAERNGGVSLAGRQIRSPTVAHRWSRRSSRRRHGHPRQQSCWPCGQSCDHIHPKIVFGVGEESCRRPFGLPCLSTRPMFRLPRRRYERSRKLPALSDRKFRFSTPAPAAKSRRPSLTSRASEPTRSSLPPTASSSAGASNLRRCNSPCDPDGPCHAPDCRSRRADELWHRQRGHVSSGRSLHERTCLRMV
jgi:hypothetical protein